MSRGIWLQIPGVDGITKVFLGKVALLCFPPTQSTVSGILGRTFVFLSNMSLLKEHIYGGSGLFSDFGVSVQLCNQSKYSAFVN